MTNAIALAEIRLSIPPHAKGRGGEWDWFFDSTSVSNNGSGATAYTVG